MARRGKRLRDLPLFVSNDEHLAEAVVDDDPETKETWIASLPKLEGQGFPRKTQFGRYWPAVKDFYDRFYCVGAYSLQLAPPSLHIEPPCKPKRGGFRTKAE